MMPCAWYIPACSSGTQQPNAGCPFARVSFAVPATQGAAMTAVPSAEIGTASGTFNTLRQLGGVFGVAICAAVFAASLAGLAPKRVLPVFGLRSAIPAEREIFVVPDGERAAVFDESLQLLRSVLEQQDVAFAGDYFAVSSADVEPRAAQAARHLARRIRASGISAHRPTRRRVAR